ARSRGVQVLAGYLSSSQLATAKKIAEGASDEEQRVEALCAVLRHSTGVTRQEAYALATRTARLAKGKGDRARLWARIASSVDGPEREVAAGASLIALEASKDLVISGDMCHDLGASLSPKVLINHIHSSPVWTRGLAVKALTECLKRASRRNITLSLRSVLT